MTANNSDYKEGQTVPFEIDYSNNVSVGGPYSAVICRDFVDSGDYGYIGLAPFDTSRNAGNPPAPTHGAITSSSAAGAWPAGTFQGHNLTITSVSETGGQGTCTSSTARETIVTFNSTSGTDAILYFGGVLSKAGDAIPGGGTVGQGHSAGFFNGGSLHMHLNSPNKDAGINPGAIIILASIKVNKVVDSGSALPAQWCFNISPNPNTVLLPLCPASGASSVQFVALNSGSYTITETSLANYHFASGQNVSNCPFTGSTATATVTAATTAVNAECTFHNTRDTGKLELRKTVVPSTDTGKFDLFAKQSSVTKLSALNVGDGGTSGAGGTTLDTGSYDLSEAGHTGTNLSDYTSSLACKNRSDNSAVTVTSGSISLLKDADVICTWTNTLKTITLTVIKHVINNNGGGATAGQWTMHIKQSGTDVSGKSPFAGAESPGVTKTLTAGSYNVSESDGPSGYTQTGIAGDCAANGDVTLAPGDNKTCTITNDDVAPTLTVIKHVVNDNGGGATANQWSLHVQTGNPLTDIATSPQAGSEAGTVYHPNAGSYNVNETGGPSGYTQTGISGGCAANGNVTLAVGDSKTCTITNDDVAPTLTVIKHVVNDNGGGATANQWSLHVQTGNPLTDIATSPQAGSEAGTVYHPNAGSYNVNETGGPSGYTQTGISGGCAANGNVTLAVGDSKTCTITNDDVAPTLTVIKHVVNDNGGGATANQWSLHVQTGNPLTDIATSPQAGSEAGTVYHPNAGSYNVNETGGPSGYTQTGISGGCAANGNVTLAVGDSKTCTITNNDQQATITVVKKVINDNGGKAEPDDFKLTLEGNATTSGTAVNVDPGTYTAGETQLSGYTFDGFSDDCDEDGKTTVALGEHKTCTLTNNDQQATITVVKKVINDNGGKAEPDDFKLTLEGNATTSGTAVNVDPGTYTAGETQLSGYTFDGFSDDCDEDGKTTVALGEHKTCTLTNNDQQATITVVKKVINDNGGKAEPDDFKLTLEGNATTSGTAVNVDPGTYTAGETQLSGYTFDGFSDDCDEDGKTTVALGEHKTCTLTNNDQQATITVVKKVINDNGGKAEPDDFKLTLEGNATTSGTAVNVDPGTYTAGETQLSGYTFDGFSDDCDEDGKTTVALGEHKTCTLTNNDQQATITVVKKVINDNGGKAEPDDFKLTLEGNATTSGTAVNVDPGTYTAGETQLSGYTFDGFSDDCDEDGKTTVALGEHKTCTLTNNDQQATITVVKKVINDNGGKAEPDDFKLTLEGNATTSGTAVNVDPGTYTAGETQLSGYTFDGFSDDCDEDGKTTVALGEHKTCTLTNNDQQATITVVKKVINDNGGKAEPDDFKLTLEGNATTSGTAVNVDPGTYTAGETQLSGYTFDGFSDDCDEDGKTTVALGEHKTCTLTNNDQQATITVVKKVINDNGGKAEPDDFKLTLEGNATTSGTAVNVDPGTYTAGETQLSGYTFDGFSDDCDEDGKTTVALGEHKTCTLTNNDQQATITVVKKVINDNGGKAEPDDFKLTLEGNATTSGTAVNVDPGTYTAGETQLSGYTFDGFSDDCDEDGKTTVALGEHKTCTLTNNDQQATITVVKKVINDNGGKAEPDDFKLTLEGNATTSGTAVNVDPGTYTAGETQLSGYTFDGFSDDCDEDGKTTVALGEHKTCTLTNNDQQATITVVKKVINDNGGKAEPDDFKLTLEGNATTSGTAVNVDPGTYTAGETQLSGYTFDGFSDDCDEDGKTTVALGEHKTCTLTNNDKPGKLIVIKHVINDNGGKAVASDFKMSTHGANASPADGFNGQESPGTTVTLDAGSYNVTETGPSGYTASFSYYCAGSIANGQTKTCTVTNDDQAAKLIVIKHVINNNGGTKVAADFKMSTAGGHASPADGFNGQESPGTTVTLDAGSYNVTETGPSGYTASFSYYCAGTIANGQTKTCTVTNDDQPGTLIVKKVVVNDNGGTKIATDFSFKVNNGAATPFQQDTDTLHGKNTITVNAGTYSVTEPAVYGYTTTYSNCSNVQVANGGTQTCTITNNDDPGTIVVIKNAKPAQGNFTFTTTGTGYQGFQLTGSTANNGNKNTQTVNAGTYTVKETTQLGWLLTGIGGSTDPETPYNCVVTGSGGSTGVGDLTNQTATINLKNGDTVTCTFENTGQGVTRTQGFWATHPDLAAIAWNGGSGFGHTFPGVATAVGNNQLCGTALTINASRNPKAPAQNSSLMGGFWADISKTTGGKKRSNLNQAKMQLLQQLLAAELNASAFGSTPSNGSFTAWETAFCGSNLQAVKDAQQQAASFNSQGDNSNFTPGTSADSKFARYIANLAYWDSLN